MLKEGHTAVPPDQEVSYTRYCCITSIPPPQRHEAVWIATMEQTFRER